ncbi:DUF2486 family protein [Trinickia soli]|jgi:hypothetical protein|uniref:DUF2486 domain-containing protein n=1 Tax=Trinickia soli TaxID=380675 RepID=A0A2N7W0I4_9BURK|nr:DUF2486 family protein [Trinickia soli]KAA0089930.1 DUF2486 family protein [Paraburkholderia sp. T12-10]PMS22918.1 DUF2486 domain-containing protein [Trinickia soli]CAB3682223.1 hypothetical protein LMG24076_02487 [Trinickia soli]
MSDPNDFHDPHGPHDPGSIPMLTDVIVPGRPPIGRPGEAHGDAPTAPSPAHALEQRQPAAVPEPAAAMPSESARAHYGPSAPTSVPTSGAAFDARDVEFIAERLRGRFSTYLRGDARHVIEERCRGAIEEHTNWLVRQVTREVVAALEAEVAGWVRDAVSEELTRHTSQR